ncbi:MAG: YciI family protein [Solirubrobacteraceae bacterium]
MKYAVLVYEKPGVFGSLAESERTAVSGEYYALRDDARCLDGAHLQPIETATTVRVDGGRTLTTDGPFADTKEVFGGYYVFEAPVLDDAIEFAARVPAARLGGKVEVRPLVEL